MTDDSTADVLPTPPTSVSSTWTSPAADAAPEDEDVVLVIDTRNIDNLIVFVNHEGEGEDGADVEHKYVIARSGSPVRAADVETVTTKALASGVVLSVKD